MGLLDDAIREHLDLKRQHGAARDDVERLEKEAFGPPTRPGDPEFEEGEGEQETDTAHAAAAVGEPPSEEYEAPSEEYEAPSEEYEAPASGFFDGAAEFGDEAGGLSGRGAGTAEPASSELPGPAEVEAAEEEWGDGEEESWSEHEAVGFEPESDEAMTSAERARRDHADLGDTVDHPSVTEPESGEELPAGTEPAEPAEASIFSDPGDEEGEGDMLGDLDFDLDLGEGASATEESGRAERADEPASAEQPLDPATAERPAPAPAEGEEGLGDEDEGYVEGEEEGFVSDDVEEDELEDEDEDLLEETPDFLQDAPEGERLWFEQGEPRDFDFDD